MMTVQTNSELSARNAGFAVPVFAQQGGAVCQVPTDGSDAELNVAGFANGSGSSAFICTSILITLRSRAIPSLFLL